MEYVRVKLNKSKQNKAKGFYILATNCETHSNKRDEFIIEKKFVKLLKNNNISFEEIPLHG
ncbi:MAG: hypothetical protein ABIF40_02310 [archaeon]